MKIYFFGKIGDRLGREVELDVPGDGCTVAELRRRVVEAFPAASRDLADGRVRACVDHEIVPEAHHVEPRQEVAFIPPLSGG